MIPPVWKIERPKNLRGKRPLNWRWSQQRDCFICVIKTQSAAAAATPIPPVLRSWSLAGPAMSHAAHCGRECSDCSRASLSRSLTANHSLRQLEAGAAVATDIQTHMHRYTYHTTHCDYQRSISLVPEWLACWTQAQKGPGSNRSCDTVGVTVSGKLFTPIVPLFTKQQKNW